MKIRLAPCPCMLTSAVKCKSITDNLPKGLWRRRSKRESVEYSAKIKESEVDVVLESGRSTISSRRLWSSLNSETLKHEPGSVLGAIALVAGTTVGAGILALPEVTQESGFAASGVALCGVWLFSIFTGLLVAEVNLNTMCELGSGGVSLMSMAGRTLGKFGTRASAAAYIFLHYCLLVAYTSRAGEILGEWLSADTWLGGAVFAFSLGGLCYAANTRTLNIVNTGLVIGVVVSFLALLFVGGSDVQLENLAKANWSALPKAISILSLTFVYHNIIPVIMSDLEGDMSKVRASIVVGTFIPLVMYLLWDGTVLGSSMPLVGRPDSADSVGVPGTVAAIKVFSIFSVGTSYIGFVLGLTDFISDALKLPSGQQPVSYAITLLPPLVLAVTYPDIFLPALDFAGTYGVLILFGVLPPLMAWSERYSNTTITSFKIVPGGKPMLITVGSLATLVIGNELLGLLHVQF